MRRAVTDFRQLYFACVGTRLFCTNRIGWLDDFLVDPKLTSQPNTEFKRVCPAQPLDLLGAELHLLVHDTHKADDRKGGNYGTQLQPSANACAIVVTLEHRIE